ncbi:hypothetical protein [Photobacterium sp. GB-72]|uniref:hypothetical protein n=1 Tax=Photobacterium sp. GB-72 TaxID=2022105 RepID=UPI000D169E65|nr:hypothetical protein [Photobacterium sp. GB-72]PSV29282.1 hypothetical protein C9J40_18020 [Photobacterium sp. GB-72]
MEELFKGIVKDRTNADIGWMINKSPFYNEGYKIAARELTVDYDNRITNEKDALVFPIVFLYRQYLELTLKDLIRELDKKLGYKRNDKILSLHKLLPLWDAAIEQYEAFIKQENITLIFTPKIKKERLIVNQFNKIDEDSFSFRYATDKKGNETVKGINYISVDNFKSQIEIVVSYVDGMIETLCHTKT